MRGFVWGILSKHNEELYQRLEKAQQKVGDELIKKKNRCKSIIEGIDDLRECLQVQFASSK